MMSPCSLHCDIKPSTSLNYNTHKKNPRTMIDLSCSLSLVRQSILSFSRWRCTDTILLSVLVFYCLHVTFHSEWISIYSLFIEDIIIKSVSRPSPVQCRRYPHSNTLITTCDSARVCARVCCSQVLNTLGVCCVGVQTCLMERRVDWRWL